MSDASQLRIPCPRCRKTGTWFAAEWGPFCSRQCKWIDLGQWFNEEQVISRPLAPGDFEGFDELPPGPELDRTP